MSIISADHNMYNCNFPIFLFIKMRHFCLPNQWKYDTKCNKVRGGGVFNFCLSIMRHFYFCLLSVEKYLKYSQVFPRFQMGVFSIFVPTLWGIFVSQISKNLIWNTWEFQVFVQTWIMRPFCLLNQWKSEFIYLDTFRV